MGSGARVSVCPCWERGEGDSPAVRAFLTWSSAALHHRCTGMSWEQGSRGAAASSACSRSQPSGSRWLPPCCRDEVCPWAAPQKSCQLVPLLVLRSWPCQRDLCVPLHGRAPCVKRQVPHVLAFQRDGAEQCEVVHPLPVLRVKVLGTLSHWQPAWCDLTINEVQVLESTQRGLKTNEGRLMCSITP